MPDKEEIAHNYNHTFQCHSSEKQRSMLILPSPHCAHPCQHPQRVCAPFLCRLPAAVGLEMWVWVASSSGGHRSPFPIAMCSKCPAATLPIPKRHLMASSPERLCSTALPPAQPQDPALAPGRVGMGHGTICERSRSQHPARDGADQSPRERSISSAQDHRGSSRLPGSCWPCLGHPNNSSPPSLIALDVPGKQLCVAKHERELHRNPGGSKP